MEINKSACTLCKRCVQVCPAGIFGFSDNGVEIVTESVETCIQCGHCAAACMSGAVVHSVFPPEKIHLVDRKALPTPEQILMLCRIRRSNRALKPDPVPREYLDRILEAAHCAPTASNRQEVRFTLVTNPEIMRRVADLTMDTFASLARKLSHPLVKPFVRMFAPEVCQLLPRFAQMKEEHLAGEDPILRKTTALIFIHTPADNRFGCEDSNLAYQNASLMAESLGVSQIYTGFVCTGIQMDRKNRIKKMLGIEGNVHAGMALGIPIFRFTKYMDKKTNEVKIWP
jgi:nitroreductase/NAD-dependent dihydropyrimidine dehydrogenase PreA subunit